MIEIDGSVGEGGGQIIRTASALSILTGKPFHIFNIRKGRQNPGLRTQHLKSLLACTELCEAKIENARIGSKDVIFEPGDFIDGYTLNISIETAGSIGLSLQMMTPAIIKSKSKFRVNFEGGAVFGKYAPPLQYIQQVLLPILRKMGYDISIDVIRYGFYPSGGAKVIAIFDPPKSHLKPIEMDTIPSIETIKGVSVATRELRNAKVAERTRMGANGLLEENGFKSEIKTVYCEANNTGCGLVLSAKAFPIVGIGSDGLGSPGLKAEFLGKYTANTIVDYIKKGCPVDPHLSDQLLIFMALAKGTSIIKTPTLTEHAKTNMDIINKFVDCEFVIEEDDNGYIISCNGFTL
ncbi:MAG: RNA 3'-terminal phosphate cyclase [Candidatus Aenigmarchaeota archaeon]|nr:RNA 3'-terminal phosphate cyclase [Candidatus Aenigmarchaeota archaeon]